MAKQTAVITVTNYMGKEGDVRQFEVDLSMVHLDCMFPKEAAEAIAPRRIPTEDEMASLGVTTLHLTGIVRKPEHN